MNSFFLRKNSAASIFSLTKEKERKNVEWEIVVVVAVVVAVVIVVVVVVDESGSDRVRFETRVQLVTEIFSLRLILCNYVSLLLPGCARAWLLLLPLPLLPSLFSSVETGFEVMTFGEAAELSEWARKEPDKQESRPILVRGLWVDLIFCYWCIYWCIDVSIDVA